jgi:hypothetical protein
LHEFTPGINGRYRVTRGYCHHRSRPAEQRIDAQVNGAFAIARDRRKYALDFVQRRHLRHAQLQTQRRRRRLQFFGLRFRLDRVGGINEQRDRGRRGNRLVQQLESFRRDLRVEVAAMSFCASSTASAGKRS